MRSTEQRRLLAVLAADIVGYSRLMAEKEAETFHRVKELQSSLIVPTVERNRGNIVKWTGDGFLSTFESAVDAVRAAVEIQSGAAAAGATDQTQHIRFRIGINTGDVIVVPDDIYGDTVNIAVRLEAAAQPGGICVARSVHDAVRGKFSVEFEDRGELTVKNLPAPVGAFDVVFNPIAWTMERRSPKMRTLRVPHRYVVAACIGATVVVAGAWFSFEKSTAPVTSGPTPVKETDRAPDRAPVAVAASLYDALLAQLGSALPSHDRKLREETARGYVNAPIHKAQAVSLDPPGAWRVSNFRVLTDAETSALEGCQVRYGQPCALVAFDDQIRSTTSDGKLAVRDMAKVRYAGEFDPAQLPVSSQVLRERGDISGYRSAAAPKAVAIHPWFDRAFVVTRAPDQRSAEQQALKACNEDPARKGADGACFLYASDNRVVLPLRLKEPLSSAAAQISGASPTTSSLLLPRLASSVPGLNEKTRDNAAHTYESAREHKAQAVALSPAGIWRSAGRPTVENAQESALENCQVAYGQPCTLLATDNIGEPLPPDGKWSLRDMSRARYAGLFDPQQIPGAPPSIRQKPEIVNYRSAPIPKAAAFTPLGGHVFPVSGALSQRAAEEQALKDCEADPARRAENAFCFLYAIGDQVVLPRRLKEPATPPG